MEQQPAEGMQTTRRAATARARRAGAYAACVVAVCLGLIAGAVGAPAQVPCRVVVEHFTNTLCSYCGLRNPGLYANIASFPGVLHLAVHPSAPYAACMLNRHNIADNDGRTRHHDIYGSTPRIVIQGVPVVPSHDYGDPALLSSVLGAMSPLAVNVQPVASTPDSVRIALSIVRVADGEIGAVRLFAAVVEDTVWYNAPNGETRHYDVMRAAVFGPSGMAVDLPQAAGDSVVVTATLPRRDTWNAGRLYALAIVEHAETRAVVQAGASQPRGVLPTGVHEPQSAGAFAVYPNPVADMVTIGTVHGTPADGCDIDLLTVTGERVAFADNVTLPYSLYTGGRLPAGVYIARITTREGNVHTVSVVVVGN